MKKNKGKKMGNSAPQVDVIHILAQDWRKEEKGKENDEDGGLLPALREDQRPCRNVGCSRVAGVMKGSWQSRNGAERVPVTGAESAVQAGARAQRQMTVTSLPR